MARLNKRAPARPAPRTHEGGLAARISKVSPGATIDATGKVVRTPIPRALEQLRRSVLACLLWENEFYEDGQSIAQRIVDAAQDVDLLDLATLATEARTIYNLRSAPMLLLGTLVERAAVEQTAHRSANGKSFVADTIEFTIQRADELTELLAIYWRNGKRPLSAQLKKGLARAFTKFDAYQLAKYDRANAIRLRDVLFLTHAKPKPCSFCVGRIGRSVTTCEDCQGSGVDQAQAALWKALASNTLEPPLTWEVELSKGGDKREVFERLLREGKLGYLALLRNLRNMAEAGVREELVAAALNERKGARRVLPFRYVAAARVVPQWEAMIDKALIASIAELPALPGLTAVLVDVSGSMESPLSARSDLSRMDAAATLASIIPSHAVSGPQKAAGAQALRVFTFSDRLVEVAPRRGMAGIDAVRTSQDHNGTYLRMASEALLGNEYTEINRAIPRMHSLHDRHDIRRIREVPYDRLIVITDEQSHDGGAALRPGAKGYLINVGSSQNGVNYGKDWVHLTGFSENILRFIAEYEKVEEQAV